MKVLLDLIRTRSVFFYVVLIFLSLSQSVTNMGLLMVINMALGGKHLVFFGEYTYLVFIGLIIGSFLASFLFQNVMADLTNKMTFDLEVSFIQKVRTASYESFEKLGTEKLYSAIGDIRMLSRVPSSIVSLVNAAVTILCSLGYLLWVSPRSCITVVSMMVALLVFYLYRNKSIAKDMNELRDLQDTYYSFLGDLLSGFKQLKVLHRRNDNLFNNYILYNRSKAKDLSIGTTKKYVVNEMTGIYSWYVILGVVIFLLPAFFHTTVAQMAAFITAVLLMVSPVWQVIGLYQFFTELRIALERVGKIYSTLTDGSIPVQDRINSLPAFKSLRFEDVVYSYDSSASPGFELHLKEFSISREEVIFITGGNGSGKSTIINLLTGLYRPTSGKVFINDREVSWTEYCEFSNNMAIVFTNQHLFQENYDGHDLSDGNVPLAFWKKLLNLEGVFKVDKENGRIDTNLSKGQQKRLALLMAMLEEKPILVLDEWAAEQDPHNRSSFYLEWLEIIRKKGKAIIAVSHDDDYFNVADRLLKLQGGRVVDEADLQTVVR